MNAWGIDLLDTISFLQALTLVPALNKPTQEKADWQAMRLKDFIAYCRRFHPTVLNDSETFSVIDYKTAASGPDL